MEFLIILIYAGLLALVAPFVLGKSERVGNLVPLGLAIVSGSALWLILTWLGLSYTDAWIWVLVMLAMPVAVWLGSGFLEKQRIAAEENELTALRAKQ